MLSYAGRIATPKAQPLPVRIGGFGGIAGLLCYLRQNGVTHVVDATHPFAATMSANAVAACAQAGVPLIALTRPPWLAGTGDQWQSVPDIAAAVAALGGPSQRILLALGRMHVADFAAQPQHHYVLRLVDAPEVPPPLPRHTVIVSRGPFDVASDIALMREHRIELVVCKNAGGSGAQAKLLAARELRLPVVMVARPALPARLEASSVPEVLQWMLGTHRHAGTSPGTERGV